MSARAIARALVVVAAGIVGACGGGGDGAGAVDAAPDGAELPPIPTGGWSTSDDTLFACFDNTNQADFGDTRGDVAATPCCVWQGEGEGMLFFANSRTGTWSMPDDDHLVITADPPCGEDCGPVEYRRDPTLTCFP